MEQQKRSVEMSAFLNASDLISVSVFVVRTKSIPGSQKVKGRYQNLKSFSNFNFIFVVVYILIHFCEQTSGTLWMVHASFGSTNQQIYYGFDFATSLPDISIGIGRVPN